MTRAELRDRFADVAFTTAVPFDGDGGVRYEAMAENVAGLYEAGARLFVPCGNTGEYYALSHEERVETVHTHVEAVGDDAVVAGGAGGSIPAMRGLVDAYGDAGADAVMVMHPDHTYLHEEGLVDYYEAVCDATDLGVVIYKRGPAVSRDVLAAVCPREEVVAVKFAHDDIKEFSQTVADVPGEVTWVNGIAERYAVPFAVEGAAGYTTGLGNFLPAATLELRDAIRDRDWERAGRIRDLLRPLEDIREETGAGNTVAAANNVPVVKYGMDLAGYTGGPVRPPLEDLAEADRRRVERHYEAVQEAPVLD